MSHTQQNELLVISKAYDHDKNYILHDFDSMLNMQKIKIKLYFSLFWFHNDCKKKYSGADFFLCALGTIRIRTGTARTCPLYILIRHKFLLVELATPSSPVVMIFVTTTMIISCSFNKTRDLSCMVVLRSSANY